MNSKKQLTNTAKSPMIRTSKMHGIYGFTIIELLLATSVFSLVLLGALAGFLQAGSLFYKGVSLTQTQAVAKQVMDDVSANVAATTSVQAPEGSYHYYCIGNTRYTYNLYKPVTPPDSNFQAGGGYGLLKDTVTGCPGPCDTSCGPSTATIHNATELLSSNMRLSQFDIAPAGPGSNLYNIKLTVAFGDSTTTLQAGDTATPYCSGNTRTQQFCAVSTLSSSVYAGLVGVSP